MKLIDVEHPFFIPLWRRIAVVIFTLVWTGFEWWRGDPFWGVIAAGLAGYSVWALLWTFDAGKVAAMQGAKDPEGEA